MTNLQLPAHLANRPSRSVAATLAANLGSGSPPHISIKGSRFTLVDGAGNKRAIDKLSLDIVIADMNPHLSKLYYAEAFDPNADDNKPPTCFSDNGVAPSSQAQKPQAQTCASCPHNVWGSDTSRMTGKATKACNDVQKLAVMLPDDPQNIIFLLRVPPASLKHLGKYAREVGAFSAGGRTVDVSDLVTRLSFDPNAVGILNFQPVSFIDEAMAGRLDKVLAGDQTKLVTGALDKPYGGQVTTPAAPAERQIAPPPPPMTAGGTGGTNLPPTVGEFPTPSPTPQSEAPARKRGRPKKDEAEKKEPATQAPFMAGTAAPADDGLEIPAFLKKNGNPDAAPPKAAGQAFGMSEAQPAPDDMQARLAEVFKLPT